MQKKITVALVGLSFGAAFVPVYKDHPNVKELVLCDTDSALLRTVAARFGITRTCESLDDVLQMADVDAVHLITPIPLHEEQSVRVLESGRHCACTVPMATTLDGVRRILCAAKQSGKRYMMMETSVYTAHYRYAQTLLENGAFGRVQFLRGAHYQDMEEWPEYWQGLPPMWYSTHAVAPLLAISGTRARKVHCFGSGTMRPQLCTRYGNSYPIETAIFDLGDTLKAEVTRSLFHTAKDYTESFTVYGEDASFEWQQIEEESPVVFRIGGKNIDDDGNVWRGRKVTWERVEMPNACDTLPEPLRRHTVKNKFYDETNPQDSFEAGGGHGGSHPFLVHAFVQSVVDDTPAPIDALTAANWTAPGICAHLSAMRGGEGVVIPDFAAELEEETR